MRRPAAVSLAALALACLAGCGNERQSAPQVPRAAAPSGTRAVRLAAYGVAFVRPRNWALSRTRSPGVAVVSSGRAVVALWRYRRVEGLPRSAEDLVRAR